MAPSSLPLPHFLSAISRLERAPSCGRITGEPTTRLAFRHGDGDDDGDHDHDRDDGNALASCNAFTPLTRRSNRDNLLERVNCGTRRDTSA